MEETFRVASPVFLLAYSMMSCVVFLPQLMASMMASMTLAFLARVWFILAVRVALSSSSLEMGLMEARISW